MWKNDYYWTDVVLASIVGAQLNYGQASFERQVEINKYSQQ